MEEGKIVSWIKKINDEIESGEVLFEVETDKATMEYEAPDDGYLVKIICEVGQTVSVNSLVAIISESKSFNDEDLKDFLSNSKITEDKSIETTDKLEINIDQNKISQLSNSVKLTSLARRVSEQNNINVSSIAPSGRKIRVNDLFQKENVNENNSRTFISPAAKIISINNNINIKDISGSGPDNRIILRDLNMTSATNENKLRKAIAKATLYSKQNIPHFYLNSKVRMDNLLEFRKKHKLSGNRYSLNGLLMFAISESFKAFPQANCTYSKNDEFIVNNNIDIGLAVDSDAGLKMPVLKNIETMDLNKLSSSLNNLIESARSNSLTPDDLKGGIISISNLGSFNIRSFDAIIFPGQTYILSVGQIFEDVVVSKGDISTGNFMNLTLACDHRAVDGVLAAKFLSNIAHTMEKIK
jgi:pyruvate dehydrogenase E2 component (dihydrolipoamide acetyltransferase)